MSLYDEVVDEKKWLKAKSDEKVKPKNRDWPCDDCRHRRCVVTEYPCRVCSHVYRHSKWEADE